MSWVLINKKSNRKEKCQSVLGLETEPQVAPGSEASTLFAAAVISVWTCDRW